MGSEKDLKIEKLAWAIERVQQTIEEAGYKYVFIALYGSQNYLLDTENSDFDWYAAVEPSFHNFVFNIKPTSTVLQYEYGQITIKDVREMFQMFKKGGFNFLEIPFSKTFIVKDKFQEEWDRLYEIRDAIARINPYATIRSFIGVAGNYLKDSISNKDCARILHTANQITSYINGEYYENVLKSEKLFSRDFIMSIKTEDQNQIYLDTLANSQFEYIQRYGTNYLRDKVAADMIDHLVEEELDNILINICKKKDW